MRKTKFIMSVFALFVCVTFSADCLMSKEKGFKTINAVIVGDRVLDVFDHLGVRPKAIAVRASQWPKGMNYPAKLLGCPVKTTIMDKTIIPGAIESLGLDTLIIEKNPQFCLLMKKADPEKAAALVKDKKVRIVTFDFSKGVEPFITEIAAYLGKEKEGEKLIADYRKELSAAKQKVKKVKWGKKIVILKTMIKKETGRLFIYAESKGHYTDHFFINPFHCKNVSDILNSEKNPVEKGHFPVTDLSLLIKANPDVIIVYGDSVKLREKINNLSKKNAEFSMIPAVKNRVIIDSLPYYAGSDVIDYPAILSEWTETFTAL